MKLTNERAREDLLLFGIAVTKNTIGVQVRISPWLVEVIRTEMDPDCKGTISVGYSGEKD